MASASWYETNLYTEWCENHLCVVCQYSSWLIYKVGDILPYPIACRNNIYPWMQICLSCVNKLENDEEDEEEEMDISTDDVNDVAAILRTFIDDEGDTWIPITNIDPWAGMWTPFGPGERITAETIFF